MGVGGQVEIVADGFAPGIGAVGVDVFVPGRCRIWTTGAKSRSLATLGIREKQPASEGGRYRTPGALAAIALAGLKTAATTAKSRSLATLGMTPGARGH